MFDFSNFDLSHIKCILDGFYNGFWPTCPKKVEKKSSTRKTLKNIGIQYLYPAMFLFTFIHVYKQTFALCEVYLCIIHCSFKHISVSCYIFVVC